MNKETQDLAGKLRWPMVITCLACIGVVVVSRITINGWSLEAPGWVRDETPGWTRGIADIAIMVVAYVLGWSRGVMGEGIWPIGVGKKK